MKLTFLEVIMKLFAYYKLKQPSNVHVIVIRAATSKSRCPLSRDAPLYKLLHEMKQIGALEDMDLDHSQKITRKQLQYPLGTTSNHVAIHATLKAEHL